MNCPTCGKAIVGAHCPTCGPVAQEPAPVPPLAANEQVLGVYEMLWDCAFCGTKALRAKSNRNCPNCGAVQEPARRYFPPDGEEVAVNTSYEGVDRVCPACQTPNGAKANHCRQCGSPLDQAKAAQRQADEREGPAAAPVVTMPPRSRRWLVVVAGLAVALVAFVVIAAVWKRALGATVESLTWSREIDVEALVPVRESSWCDSMPFDVYAISRSRRQRSTERIPDGQECHTRKVDRGDGTYERRQTCETRYRERPIYDDECSYTVHRWRRTRTERSGGGLENARRWPDVNLARLGACLGCERTAGRREQYQVTLVDEQGKHHQCAQPEWQWQQFVPGQRYPVRVRVITGGLDCGSLRP